MYLEALQHPIFKIVNNLAELHQTQVYVVGGYVRDYFLNRPCKDIDFTIEGDGIAFANEVYHQLGEKSKLTYFKTYGTANIKFEDMEYEFVGARKESYQPQSRNPIVESGTLIEDLERRDFTINAMAFGLNNSNFGTLIDPFLGYNDLKEHILKTPVKPNQTFIDDPLRMIRGIRFATQLNFNLEAETYQSIKANSDRLKIITQERITEELNKILLSAKPSIGFKLLDDCNLLEQFFPEFTKLKGIESKNGLAHKDNFYHTLQVLDNVSNTSNDLWLRWAAVLHDIAKPATKRFIEGEGWTFHGHEDKGAKMVKGIFKKLRLPLNEKMKFVEKMVLLHLRPIVLSKDLVTDSAIRRLIFDAGDDIENLLKLCKADITTKNGEKAKRYAQNLELVKIKVIEVEEKDRIRNWQPPIDGLQIMDMFGLQAGREIGILKTALKNAILDGIIENNYESSVQFISNEASKLNLVKKKL